MIKPKNISLILSKLSKKLKSYTRMFVKKLFGFRYSKLNIPIVDVTRYLDKKVGWENDC